MHTDRYSIPPSNWHLSPTFCLPFLVLFLFLTFSLALPLSNTLPHMHIHTLSVPWFSPPFEAILTAVFVTNHPSNSPTSHLLLLLAAAEFTITLAEEKKKFKKRFWYSLVWNISFKQLQNTHAVGSVGTSKTGLYFQGFTVCMVYWTNIHNDG